VWAIDRAFPTRLIAHHLAPVDFRSTLTRSSTVPSPYNIRSSTRESACELDLPRYGRAVALPVYELRRVGDRASS
jgi:hypothetical protein